MKRNFKFVAVLCLVFAMLLSSCGTSTQGAASESETSVVAEEVASAVEETPEVSPSETPDEEVSSVEEPPEDPADDALSEADVQDAIAGIDDLYVVKDAEDINFMVAPVFDAALIESIEVDASAVDFGAPGEYDIIYHVSAYDEAITAYNAGSYDNNGSYAKTTRTADITRTVTIVTEDEATELADRDVPVLTSGNGYVPKSDGTQVEIPDPAVPASVETTQGDVISADTGEVIKIEEKPEAKEPEADETPDVTLEEGRDPEPPADTPAPTKAPSTSSGTTAPASTPKPTSAPAPAATSTPKPAATPRPTSTPKPAATPTPKPAATPAPTPTPHSHTWVTVAATGHYESVQTGTQTVQTGTIHHDAVTHEKEIWDSHYRCLNCGYTCKTGDEITIHEGFECHAAYTVDEWIDHYETVVDQDAWDEAVYEDQPIYEDVWVEDSAAYEKCSGCGATR